MATGGSILSHQERVMSGLDLTARISRRRALTLTGGMAAGGVLTGAGPLAGAALAQGHGDDRDHRHRHHHHDGRPQHGDLPADQIQQIVQAQGTLTKGVLSIDISRDDIGEVSGPLGVTFTPAFEIDGTLTFQPLGDADAFFNGDIPLKPEETQAVIDAIIANDLTFQAFHQHYIETTPNIWFIHFRGEGDALKLAAAVHDVLKATGTPLPQRMPANPTTPLDADRLGSILHGDAQVGDEGVVTVTIDRSDTIVIDGIRVSPEANISTNVQFKPLSASGSQAAVGPDFSMKSSEVMPVVSLMRSLGWFQGCLYNQETNEYPQLYFDHMLKVGDAYALAQEVRRGLDRTAAS
jgi:hypothetical protein